MTVPDFFAVAWNNGAYHTTGAGYGLKLSAADRDAHIRREWRHVSLVLPGRQKPLHVNIDKSSFWNDTCRELISRDIGAWLIAQGLGRWSNGEPPRIGLRVRGDGAFDVLPFRGLPDPGPM
jgi:hypothetical protein